MNATRSDVGASKLTNLGADKVNCQELQKLEAFFRRRFALSTISVKQRPQKDDSAEVYIGDEFVGVVFRDDEDGDLSYNFTMAILDIDLD